MARLTALKNADSGKSKRTHQNSPTAVSSMRGNWPENDQVVMPMLKQRNPDARRQAVETLNELARLGQGLRGAMLRAALREYLESG